MKHLLAILLFLSFSCSAQKKFATYKMNMNVRATRADGRVICKNDLPVIWGIARDTVAFVVEGRKITFYPPGKATWCSVDERISLENQIKMYWQAGVHMRVVRDSDNNKYLLKILTVDGDVAIYIVNIHDGLPSYQFGFGCNKCTEEELGKVR